MLRRMYELQITRRLPLFSFRPHGTRGRSAVDPKRALNSRAFLAVALLAIGCQSIGPSLTFEEAYRRAKAQPADLVDAYLDKWDAFNNANHIDEKDGCYQKSPGAIQQVLVLDASGTVTHVIADGDNLKSQCFRSSYLNVQFPPPPFAPYYVYLQME